MDADGSNIIQLTESGKDHRPTWSPDGTKIAFYSGRDGNFEIYVMNPDGSDETNLTRNGHSDMDPVWSPDGSKIAFTASIYPYYDEIYIMNADGSGKFNLSDNPKPDNNPGWSPDGTQIAFESERDGNLEIYIRNIDGSGLTNITNNPSNDWQPAWSPDGTKIAFVRDYLINIYEIASGNIAPLLENDQFGIYQIA